MEKYPRRHKLAQLKRPKVSGMDWVINSRPAAVFLTCLALALAAPTAHAQLRGHGGPVRTLAISSDGGSAISGSFDSSAIRWSLDRNAAEQVLQFHVSAV